MKKGLFARGGGGGLLAKSAVANSNESLTSEEESYNSSSSLKQEPTKIEKMELIDAVNMLFNKIAACGHKLNVNLPKIAVVGPENSGKTCVLNSFAGKDYLPKGNGLVTRRPTIIQFQPTQGGEEYATFSHVPKQDGVEKRFFDFEAICQEIRDETDGLLGPTEFSSEPINVTIYSPNVLKITLVDLPGLVKVAVGEQDASVVQTVRDMIMENIRDPRTIILAVCPANAAIATSDALQIAKDVDPERERTIGVVTKLDLMDAGTNALDVLENRKLPLARGYVGVVNRSQQDIDNGRDRAYERAKEKKFFENSCYSHLAHRMGSQYLQELLQKSLRLHIQHELPALREELSLRLYRLQGELRTFEEKVGKSADDGGNNFYLMSYVKEFITKVTVHLKGYSVEEITADRATSGAYLNLKLNTEAQKFLSLDMTPDIVEITILMANLAGVRNSVSLPSLTVNGVCQKQVGKFKEPLEMSLNSIKDILMDSVVELASVMDRYPSLKNEVMFKIKQSISELTDETRDKLIHHCHAEQFSVNVGHPDFDSEACKNIAPTAGITDIWKQSSGNPSTNGNNLSASSKVAMDHPQTRELVSLLMQNENSVKRATYVSQTIVDYLEIVKKNVSDVYFKYISYFLISKFLEYLNKKLEIELGSNWSTNLSTNLMQDCEEDFKKKAEMESECAYLEEVLELIKAF